ncbi:MAG: N-6 DNA methylase, partial [Fusobacteriaceae bacterium]
MGDKSIFELYNESIENFYKKNNGKSRRKELSQFFTPKLEAEKMVENLYIEKKDEIIILEPSCGYGILVLVLLDKILSSFTPKNIEIYLCDVDKEMTDTSKKFIKKFFEENHFNDYKINISNENFLTTKIIKKMDYIISNPPYKKINMDSLQKSFVKKYVNGQPNLYNLFIGKSLELLAEKGKYIV